MEGTPGWMHRDCMVSWETLGNDGISLCLNVLIWIWVSGIRMKCVMVNKPVKESGMGGGS